MLTSASIARAKRQIGNCKWNRMQRHGDVHITIFERLFLLVMHWISAFKLFCLLVLLFIFSSILFVFSISAMHFIAKSIDMINQLCSKCVTYMMTITVCSFARRTQFVNAKMMYRCCLNLVCRFSLDNPCSSYFILRFSFFTSFFCRFF